ncbi:MAG: aminoacyl-tRNA hydrolase [Clostridia bacterium]|nr:aminoacyl-tRNA hydrolase [Clostridia bacterium]
MKKESVFSALLKSAGLILLFYAVMYLALFLGQQVIAFCLGAKGVPAEELKEALEKTILQLNYEIMLLFALLFVGLVLLIYRKSWGEATGFRKLSGGGIVSSLLMGFGGYLLAIFLINLSAMFPAFVQSQEDYLEMEEALQTSGGNLWIEMLYVAVLCPIVEELLFRGLILHKLCRVMPASVAIGLSGAAFALVHGNLYQLAFTLPMGIFLGFLVYRFRSIWASILFHAAFNFTNYPLRIAEQFGLSMESAEAGVMQLLLWGFCLLCLIAGIVLLRRSLPEKPAAAPVFPSETATQFYQGEAMAAPEFIIVGLGNPGDKYAATRHNCGFMAVDYIALRENVTIKNARFHALVGEITLGGRKGLLMKPTTFMNLSGDAVREAAAFYRIPPERVLVIFDDINFRPGLMRIRADGSAGGHNGIKSVIARLGSEAFPRVKIGIGSPAPGMELMHHVLGKPPAEEQDALLSVMEDVYDTTRLFAAGDLPAAMARFNGKK